MAKKSTKLPKKIAGVKIPKKVRKSGGKLLKVANTPAGRELIAAGLLAAGGALARAQQARRGETDTGEHATDPAERGAQMAGQIGAAVTAAASAALDRLFGDGGSSPEDASPPRTRAH